MQDLFISGFTVVHRLANKIAKGVPKWAVFFLIFPSAAFATSASQRKEIAIFVRLKGIAHNNWHSNLSCCRRVLLDHKLPKRDKKPAKLLSPIAKKKARFWHEMYFEKTKIAPQQASQKANTALAVGRGDQGLAKRRQHDTLEQKDESRPPPSQMTTTLVSAGSIKKSDLQTTPRNSLLDQMLEPLSVGVGNFAPANSLTYYNNLPIVLLWL